MNSFYKKWLEKNKEENKIARQQLAQQQQNIEDSQNSDLKTKEGNKIARQQLAQQQNEDSQNSDLKTKSELNQIKHINDLVFENDQLQLIIEKGAHLHQIKFRIEDHLFYMKIKLKNEHAPHPLLRDILDFLQSAFNYILINVRKFYKEEDHNIAYLTLYQEPMVSGLNTGKIVFL